jgi:hypothetical protein
LENAPQLFEPQRERLLLESGAKRLSKKEGCLAGKKIDARRASSD